MSKENPYETGASDFIVYLYETTGFVVKIMIIPIKGVCVVVHALVNGVVEHTINVPHGDERNLN